MRKHMHGRKLSRTSNERKQLFRNLVSSLAKNGFVVTSRAKAKTIVPIVEKLVTVAKADSLPNFRKLISETGNKLVAQNLLVVGKAFVNRSGGYTRILRLANQKGDDREIVRLEWVEKILLPEVIKTKDAEKKEQKLNTKDLPKIESKEEKKKPKTRTRKLNAKKV